MLFSSSYLSKHQFLEESNFLLLHFLVDFWVAMEEIALYRRHDEVEEMLATGTLCKAGGYLLCLHTVTQGFDLKQTQQILNVFSTPGHLTCDSMVNLIRIINHLLPLAIKIVLIFYMI